ncbi:MAG: S1C family serine protease [Candidatus Magasanikbacteria bacterium]|nr:S1C family serine protease [Candidatus Magasanikbacteria bacterium]
MHPPHLPNPVCDIKQHDRWLRVKLIITVAVFGLLAGITGASMALGWIWPGYGGGDTWIVSQNRSTASRGNLDEVIYKESAEKIYSVYRDMSHADSLVYLSEDNKIGEAAAISSDGWMVMYVPKNTSVAGFAKWRVLGSDGATYEVAKTIFDPYVRLVYFKVSVPSGNDETKSTVTQFKVASFLEVVSAYDDIYVRENNDWRFSQTLSKQPQTFGSIRLDSAINYSFPVNSNFQAGTVAINNRGRVAGFVMENNMLLPSMAVIRIMPGVLSRQVIEYPSFGAVGWFSVDQPVIYNNARIEGFAVDRVWSKKSQLRRGDVITEINGQIVSDENLWYTIGDSKATLTVWRAGKIFDLPADIIKAGADSI